MPALYVVATPIGNLEDISFRAIRILKEVELIAAEDTRKTRKLLSHYQIHTHLTSYHEHSKLTKLRFIVDILASKDVALVSDAGMPGISDPGFELISEVIKLNIPVIPIPGPSALISAVVVSGLQTDNFHFLGFLPHKGSQRRRLLQSVENEPNTLVMFESPHRISASLKDLLEIAGDRRIAVCRELTKIHEEIFRGTISLALQHFSEPRGEFTLIVEGRSEPSTALEEIDTAGYLHQLKQAGVAGKDAIRQAALKTGLSRKELYKAWINLK